MPIMRRILLSVPVLLVGLTMASVTTSHAAPSRSLPRVPRCTGCVQFPDIEVTDSLTAQIPNGTGTFDVGTTTEGTDIEKYFVVGNLDLLPDLIGVVVTLPSFLTLKYPVPSTILGGAAHGATVICDASTPGDFSGTVSIASNDPDENPYTFTITCTVEAVTQDSGGDTNDTVAGDTSGSGAGIPTTGSNTTELILLSLGLIALGSTVGLIARRRA